MYGYKFKPFMGAKKKNSERMRGEWMYSSGGSMKE